MTENKNINSIVPALIEGHHRMDVEWTKHFCDKEKYPQPEPEHIILAKTLDEFGFKQEIKASWIEEPTFGFEEQYTALFTSAIIVSIALMRMTSNIALIVEQGCVKYEKIKYYSSISQ